MWQAHCLKQFGCGTIIVFIVVQGFVEYLPLSPSVPLRPG